MLNLGDHAGNFLRRLGGPLSQFAHFIGHHRKAASLLARTCGFNSRVKRKQIGLVGNVLDDINNAGNLPREVFQFTNGAGGGIHRIGNPPHFARGIVNDAPPFIGLAARTQRRYSRFSRMFFHLIDGNRQFLHRRRHAGSGLRLALTGTGTAGGDAAQRSRGLIQVVHITAHRTNQITQAVLHGGQLLQQGAQLIRTHIRHVTGQIPCGNTVGSFRGHAQRGRNTPQREPGRAQNPHYANQCQNDKYDDVSIVERLCCLELGFGHRDLVV